MFKKSIVSSQLPKLKRLKKAQAKTGARTESLGSDWIRQASIYDVAQGAVSEQLVLVDLREIASAYSSEKIPMLVTHQLDQTKKQYQSFLVIDTVAIVRAGIASQETLDPAQQQMLGAADMWSLEQVIHVLDAAGRSSVHAMESANRLFGLLPPGRIRGKRYPSWQFSRGIAGEPLHKILAKLEPVDAWSKYQFFVSSYPELGQLTPVEVLTGKVKNPAVLTDETRALIDAEPAKRVDLVAGLADEFANPS